MMILECNLKTLFLGVLILGVRLNAGAQIKTSVSLSNPYVKQTSEVLEAYKKNKSSLKDSLRSLKALNKQFDKKINSLFEPLSDYLPDSSLIDDYEINGDENDSLINSTYKYYENQFLDKHLNNYPIDSTYKIAQDTIAYEIIDDLQSRLLDYRGIDQFLSDKNDIFSSADEIEGIKSTIDRYKSKKNYYSIQNLGNNQFLKQNESVKLAHKKISSLKKKYITLPSADDLKNGSKRNSLSGESFLKRLRYGGNFQIQQSHTVDINFSPSLSYLINKQLSIGLEYMIRLEIGDDNKWSESLTPTSHGGRLFLEHGIHKNFFAHFEVESLTTKDPSTTIFNDSLITGAMAGLGRSINLSKKISGRVLILYNFVYSDNDPIYSSPLVIRFGFDLKKLSHFDFLTK